LSSLAGSRCDNVTTAAVVTVLVMPERSCPRAPARPAWFTKARRITSSFPRARPRPAWCTFPAAGGRGWVEAIARYFTGIWCILSKVSVKGFARALCPIGYSGRCRPSPLGQRRRSPQYEPVERHSRKQRYLV